MYLIFLMMISLLGCKISGGDDRAGFTIVRGGDDGVTAKGHGVENTGLKQRGWGLEMLFVSSLWWRLWRPV